MADTMSDLNDKMIRLTGEDGKDEIFFICGKTKINGTDYYLLAKNLEYGSDAYIARDISGEDDYTAVFEFVDDDKEVEYIGKIFAELLDFDDVEIERD